MFHCHLSFCVVSLQPVAVSMRVGKIYMTIFERSTTSIQFPVWATSYRFTYFLPSDSLIAPMHKHIHSFSKLVLFPFGSRGCRSLSTCGLLLLKICSRFLACFLLLQCRYIPNKPVLLQVIASWDFKMLLSKFLTEKQILINQHLNALFFVT